MPINRRERNPMTDLILEIRTAARQIDLPQARSVAAREADRIPLTMAERAHGARGKMAKLARKHMRALPDLAPEAFAEAAEILRHCADALDSRFEVTSEVHLGRKGRSRTQAA